MSDPSFLLQPDAAKDMAQYALDLQALIDLRSAALDQPLSGPDFDLSGFDEAADPTPDVSH